MKTALFDDNISYIFANNESCKQDLHELNSKCQYAYETEKSIIAKDIFFDKSLFIGDYSATVLESLSGQLISPDSVSLPRYSPEDV